MTALAETIEEVPLFIDGKEEHAANGASFEITSPANGEPIARIAEAGAGEVDRAVRVVEAAMKEWAARSAYDREKIIRKATAYVRGKADEIGRLMAMEQGKPFDQSKSEIGGSCDTLDYYAAEGVRIEGYTNPTEKPGFRSTVIYQPVGVCALFTPWNYPVALLSWKLGPALAAGCGVVVKPSEVTPMSPTAFCRALVEGGIPAGLIAVLHGPGATVGDALLRHPTVKKIAMTGSSATGKKILGTVGPLLKKVSLELGGHCPAVVCADADPKLAAKIIAYKGFRNMGQSCSGVNRVFVHESIQNAVVEELRKIAESQTIGDGVTDGSVDLGPMATRAALEHVEAHVEDAREKGATIVCGGKRPEGSEYANGNYYLPTIVTNVPKEARMLREETFGPVVPFIPFTDLDEAIAQANDTDYGLVAYLFTRDYATTIKASEALEAGTVCVNHGSVNTNYAPYEGWKDSGFGVELSRRAIHEYLRSKHIKTVVE